MPIGHKPLKSVDRALLHAFGGSDSYVAVFEGTTLGSGVRHATIWNGDTSGLIVSVHDIRLVNLAIAAITGTAERFEVQRIVTNIPSNGTSITPRPLDSRTPDLPAEPTLIFRRAVTAGPSDEHMLFPMVVGTDEVTPSSVGQIGDSLYMPYGFGIEPIRVNPNEGLTVKQTTAGTVGSIAVVMAFSVFSDV